MLGVTRVTNRVAYRNAKAKLNKGNRHVEYRKEVRS